MRAKMEKDYRCLYLGAPATLDSIRSSLVAAGVNVEREVSNKRLVLSADREHLVNGRFDMETMLRRLEDTFHQALHDGYEGLWASGDMSWEMGPYLDYSSLLEYEQRLEVFLRENPRLSGLCQYTVDSLPPQVVRQGLLAHSSIFVDENVSLHNPYFRHADTYMKGVASEILLDSAITRICTM